MFHRVKTSSDTNTTHQDQPQEQLEQTVSETVESNKRKYMHRVDSSAVEKYAKSQEEMSQNNSANQNNNAPIEIKQTQTLNNEKEVTPMNSPETQSKDNSAEDKKPAMAPQNRDVNIPGNNFQRPGAPAQPAGRPGYPGTYAANTAANNPYGTQNNSDNGSKLVIGKGITMSGEIESCEHLIVEGTIEASLKGAQMLDVYETGAFLGTVEIDEANIAGRFEGDITVKGRLTIESTGQVIGSITYKELSMEAGAVIDGSVSPIGSENAKNNANKKASAPKAKKASSNNGAELPFSDKAGAAAE